MVHIRGPIFLPLVLHSALIYLVVFDFGKSLPITTSNTKARSDAGLSRSPAIRQRVRTVYSNPAVAELFHGVLSKRPQTIVEAPMDELSLFGVGFAVVILSLACVMALKLSSRKAYH